MFVGISCRDEGIIKVYNFADASKNHQLTGHKGQVLCLAAAGGALFSGGQDSSIRVWTQVGGAGIFVSQAILTHASGNGHSSSVHCLEISGQYMFSGDRQGVLKVWDLATGGCVQTISKAHHLAIMKILIFEETFLITGGLDGTIKCWSSGSGGPSIVNDVPDYVFEAEHMQQQRNPRGQQQLQLLTMATCTDAKGTTVLMASYDFDKFTRLYQLPTFEPRGYLVGVQSSRAMVSVPPNIMVCGDFRGGVKVFQWKS